MITPQQLEESIRMSRETGTAKALIERDRQVASAWRDKMIAEGQDPDTPMPPPPEDSPIGF